MAKMTTNGITNDTQASKLLHQHVLREQLPAATRAELADWAAQKTAQWCVPIMPTTHLTVGMERLYRRVNMVRTGFTRSMQEPRTSRFLCLNRKLVPG